MAAKYDNDFSYEPYEDMSFTDNSGIFSEGTPSEITYSEINPNYSFSILDAEDIGGDPNGTPGIGTMVPAGDFSWTMSFLILPYVGFVVYRKKLKTRS